MLGRSAFTPTSRERLVDLGVYVTQTMQPQAPPWKSTSPLYVSRGGNASHYAYCAAVMRAYTYQTPHGYVGTVGMLDKQKPTNSGDTSTPAQTTCAECGQPTTNRVAVTVGATRQRAWLCPTCWWQYIGEPSGMQRTQQARHPAPGTAPA